MATGIKYLDLYLEIVEKAQKKELASEWISAWTSRRKLVKRYAWAIPSLDALLLIKLHSPIVEMGAGGGYWAMLLRGLGVNILAYDKNPGNSAQSTKLWTEVQVGEPEILSSPDLSNRTLLLCWPPYDDPMAFDSLTAYKGNKLIYIGEQEGGCTATSEFFEELSLNWTLIDHLSIPHWDGVWDHLMIWERKPVKE